MKAIKYIIVLLSLLILAGCNVNHNLSDLNGSVWKATSIYEDGEFLDINVIGTVYLEFSETFLVIAGSSTEVYSYEVVENIITLRNQESTIELTLDITHNEIQYYYGTTRYIIYTKIK